MRSLAIHLWVLLISLWWRAPASAENRALIIGISRYESSELKPLPGVARDIPGMITVARTLGFQDRQIRVLQNEEATLANIRAAMRDWLAQGAGPNDYVLLYFSGHGSHLLDEDGDETDNPRLDQFA